MHPNIGFILVRSPFAMSASAPEPLPPAILLIVKDIVGPLVVGTLINGLITGICFDQYITYAMSKNNDKLIVRYVFRASQLQVRMLTAELA